MQIPMKHSGSDVTIFSEMTALSIKHNAINLAQGFPDYEIDDQLKQFLAQATQNNYNQYAPLAGLPYLIDQIKSFNHNRKQPIAIETHEITITAGATYAIYCALATIIFPGDEVMVLEPCYDSYVPAIESNGGKAVFVSLNQNNSPNFEAIKDKITDRTKAIIINSPHNPSGNVWSKYDWNELWKIIKNTNIIVISDEVYDLLVYDDYEFTGVLQHQELRNRAFAIFSFGKMFHITGWKVGYIVGNEELTKAFRRIHQYLCFCVNAPAQYALAKYLENFDTAANRIMMEEKRDFFLQEFRDLPFTFPEKSKGSYFQIAEYQNISSLGDKEFSVWLTQEKKVSVIPVSAFYHQQQNTGTVRFCFAKKEETIKQAAQNLRSLL